MIELKNLVKTYQLNSIDQNKVTILNHLNLQIQTGEVVAIVGTSGSGKSTLLGLVSGLDQPDSGEVIIQNQSLQKLKGEDLTQFRSSQIGIVFQQYYLVNHLTAFENLTLPLEILNKPFTHQQVMTALRNVGLDHRSEHKPNELSGGECQRLAMARALIIQPSLLLADEPSGSLDVETGTKVMSVFFDQIRQNKTTTVLVTHDLDLAKRCDRIYKLNAGQLEAVQYA